VKEWPNWKTGKRSLGGGGAHGVKKKLQLPSNPTRQNQHNKKKNRNIFKGLK